MDGPKNLFGDWEAHSTGTCGPNCVLCAQSAGKGGKRLIPDQLSILGVDRPCEKEGCDRIALCQLSTGYQFGTFVCMACAIKSESGI